MTEYIMTVKELYDFAKKHGFENATMWVGTGPNVYSSIDSANLNISSKDKDDKKQIFLIHKS